VETVNITRTVTSCRVLRLVYNVNVLSNIFKQRPTWLSCSLMSMFISLCSAV